MDQARRTLVDEDYNEIFKEGADISEDGRSDAATSGSEKGQSGVGFFPRFQRDFFEKPKVGEEMNLNSLTTIIMMHSPDVPHSQQGRADSFHLQDVENFYSGIESEETVKCILSSLIFFLIVVSVVTMVIVNNPVM